MRYASSDPAGHILGSYLLKIFITFVDISAYLEKLFETRMRSGHNFFAIKPCKLLAMREVKKKISSPGIPERTPYFLAS